MKEQLETEKLDIISQMTKQKTVLQEAKDNISYLEKKLKLVNDRLDKLPKSEVKTEKE
jgi:hypothetical protein